MISAIVLAAGKSTRMGQQKMLLPWGQTSVIGQVVLTLVDTGVTDIHLVTGGNQAEIKEALKSFKLRYSFNKDFVNGEMLISVQVGLRGIRADVEAAMIVLGDQPQIESHIVRTIMDRYCSTHHKIIVPSYQMHRGHPWLVEKSYWSEILRLNPPHTLRDFLNKHHDIIDYVSVDSPTVIQDIDTQADYAQYKLAGSTTE